MPQFRWPDVDKDLCLAREVAARRPSKPPEWDTIAGILSTAFSTARRPVKLKGRGCRERMERLLDKFRSDDRQALKRSGTEEEYSELTQLLQDIADYQRDLQDAQLKEREAKKLKEVNDKTVAEEMRKSAMETLTQRKRRREKGKNKEVDDEAEYFLDEEDEKPESPKKIKRASKLSAIEMLNAKFDKKADLKKVELDIRMKELELRQLQMDREHEEKKMEEERKQKMELEFMERKAMIELIQKLASK